MHNHLEPQSQPERNGWNSPVPTICKGFQAGAILEQADFFLVGTGVPGMSHVDRTRVTTDLRALNPPKGSSSRTGTGYSFPTEVSSTLCYMLFFLGRTPTSEVLLHVWSISLLQGGLWEQHGFRGVLSWDRCGALPSLSLDPMCSTGQAQLGLRRVGGGLWLWVTTKAGSLLGPATPATMVEAIELAGAHFWRTRKKFSNPQTSGPSVWPDLGLTSPEPVSDVRAGVVGPKDEQRRCGGAFGPPNSVIWVFSGWVTRVLIGHRCWGPRI